MRWAQRTSGIVYSDVLSTPTRRRKKHCIEKNGVKVSAQVSAPRYLLPVTKKGGRCIDSSSIASSLKGMNMRECTMSDDTPVIRRVPVEASVRTSFLLNVQSLHKREVSFSALQRSYVSAWRNTLAM
jgi:hypothetical protein